MPTWLHVNIWELVTGVLAYWKEISIVLTASFAVLGLAGDYKDKETGHLNTRGRVFLVLTVLSMAGGLIAQIEEDRQSNAIQAANDEKMLTILAQTQLAVHEMQRAAQPIDQPDVFIHFLLDCSNVFYRQYCDADTAWGHSAPGHPAPNFPLDIGTIDLIFYRDESFKLAAVGPGLTIGGDYMLIHLLLQKNGPDFNVVPGFSMRGPDLVVYEKGAKPQLYGGAIESMVDLPGAHVLIADDALHDNPPDYVALTTPKGQSMSCTGFTLKRVGQYIFYDCSIPER